MGRRYCPGHTAQVDKRVKGNQSWRWVYNTARWRRLRIRVLTEEPFCKECAAQDVVCASAEVDHIVPLSQGGDPYDRKNLQGLCKACHARKSIKEIQ